MDALALQNRKGSRFFGHRRTLRRRGTNAHLNPAVGPGERRWIQRQRGRKHAPLDGQRLPNDSANGGPGSGGVLQQELKIVGPIGRSPAIAQATLIRHRAEQRTCRDGRRKRICREKPPKAKPTATGNPGQPQSQRPRRKLRGTALTAEKLESGGGAHRLTSCLFQNRFTSFVKIDFLIFDSKNKQF